MPQATTRRRRTKSGENSDLAGVTLTHPERVLYPDKGITKRQLAEYYRGVADWILPHVVDRPLSLVRCPQGSEGKCFYQKHWNDTLPMAVDQVAIKEKSETEPYVVIHDLAGLLSLVQINVLELHPWGSQIDHLEAPDRVIFDFDPGEGVDWPTVKKAAQDCRERLAQLGLETWLRTTGGKGLHVVAPLRRRNTWDEASTFAHNFAAGLAREEPERYVDIMRKQLRRGKIYVDYLRNQRGATAIASYSTRRHPTAPVATPIQWDELGKLKSAAAFTIESIPARLKGLRRDPWDGFDSCQQSLTKKIQQQAAAMARG